jgi:hypothetical protein
MNLRVCSALLAIASALLTLPARAATPTEVELTIQKALKALYAEQKDGIWDPVNPGNADKRLHWAGETALATYALLAAGESPQDARLVKAINFLKTADITGIYALGLRAQMWQFLPLTPDNRQLIKRDGEMLLNSLKIQGPGKGMFNYPVNDNKAPRYDHSVSQYGVLGLWAVAQLGLEIPTPAWKLMDEQWRAHQMREGAWFYSPDNEKGGEARMSMTAAGVATLFITDDYLNQGKFAECNGNIRDDNIEKGLKWIAERYKGRENHYTLYGIERIGVASGHKYFGTTDWYAEGADFLVKSQNPNGAWGKGVPDTCFAILFLVRGRAPVVMNKLEYAVETAGDKAKPANWNQRPRDCANLVRWMSKQVERDLNWQVVNLKVPIDDLHDAPILYLAGNQNLDFTEEEEKKLRQFVEQGGMILANADCSSQNFSLAFQKLGQKLFPSYEFRDLPKDHLIYTSPFHYSKWKATPIIRGLSNGSRELMLLIPTADFSKLWQQQLYAGREEGHQLMWNLYFYAVDKKDMRFKGQTYIVHANPQVKPSRTAVVARLEYAGNWNPEPGGWQRLRNVMHNRDQVDLQVKTVKVGSGDLLKSGAKFAHLTGTHRFKLDAAQADELKRFVDAGGTLLVEACGGNPDFTAAAEQELAAICPGARTVVLPPDHPAYTSGAVPKLAEVNYRAFARKLVGATRAPRIKGLQVGDRTAVLFSGEDLSTGLVGMSIDGIYGYDPDSVTNVMRNLIAYGAHLAPPPPPASKPVPATKKAEPEKPKPKGDAKSAP